jgi:hypothetical protein
VNKTNRILSSFTNTEINHYKIYQNTKCETHRSPYLKNKYNPNSTALAVNGNIFASRDVKLFSIGLCSAIDRRTNATERRLPTNMQNNAIKYKPLKEKYVRYQKCSKGAEQNQ